MSLELKKQLKFKTTKPFFITIFILYSTAMFSFNASANDNITLGADLTYIRNVNLLNYLENQLPDIFLKTENIPANPGNNNPLVSGSIKLNKLPDLNYGISLNIKGCEASQNGTKPKEAQVREESYQYNKNTNSVEFPTFPIYVNIPNGDGVFFKYVKTPCKLMSNSTINIKYADEEKISQARMLYDEGKNLHIKTLGYIVDSIASSGKCYKDIITGRIVIISQINYNPLNAENYPKKEEPSIIKHACNGIVHNGDPKKIEFRKKQQTIKIYNDTK